MNNLVHKKIAPITTPAHLQNATQRTAILTLYLNKCLTVYQTHALVLRLLPTIIGSPPRFFCICCGKPSHCRRISPPPPAPGRARLRDENSSQTNGSRFEHAYARHSRRRVTATQSVRSPVVARMRGWPGDQARYRKQSIDSPADVRIPCVCDDDGTAAPFDVRRFGGCAACGCVDLFSPT